MKMLNYALVAMIVAVLCFALCEALKPALQAFEQIATVLK